MKNIGIIMVKKINIVMNVLKVLFLEGLFTNIYMKNRKLWLFLISLVVVAVLSFFGKETAAIITLYGVYCTGNVASKFSVTTTRKEE